jgi:hypothetical protein
MASLTNKKILRINGDGDPVDTNVQKRAEDAVKALQAAQNNLISNLEELGETTPVRLTLRNWIVKDILIISSILFWPAVIYWLW